MFRTVPLSIIGVFFTVHTAMVYVSKPVWHILLLCVQWRKTSGDGQSNCPNHVEFYSKNKFEKLVNVVGFIIRIYHDARSAERQIQFISVINHLDAQNFCFTISLFHASTCFEQHVLIIRRSKLHYTASGIITPIGVMIPEAVWCSFDLLMMSTWCSKHVEAWNKRIVKQKCCASSWLITEINILRCTVSKTSKKKSNLMLVPLPSLSVRCSDDTFSFMRQWWNVWTHNPWCWLFTR